MAFANTGEFFNVLNDRIQSDEGAQNALKQIGASYCFVLNGDDGGTWTLDLAACTVSSEQTEADCVVTMESGDFLGMVNGDEGFQGQQLFMMGKLMIAGDMTLALQLEQVFSAAAA